MRFFLTCAVISLFSFATFANAGENTYSEEPFTAKVQNIRLQSLLIAQGKKNEDLVTTQARVKLFKPSVNIDDVRQASISDIEEVNFLIEYTKANINGEVEKILSFWAPEERTIIKERLSNAEMLGRSKAYFENNPGLSVLGVVDQGETQAILQRRGAMVLGVNIIKSDNKIHLTNKPADDLELAIIEASFVQ